MVILLLMKKMNFVKNRCVKRGIDSGSEGEKRCSSVYLWRLFKVMRG